MFQLTTCHYGWVPMVMLGALGCRVCLCFTQPHSQLQCATPLARGTLRLATGAGTAPPALYDSAELQQPPIVSNVVPLDWSPSEPTTIVISGERCVKWGGGGGNHCTSLTHVVLV